MGELVTINILVPRELYGARYKMRLTDAGKMTESAFLELSQRFKNVE